MTKDERWLLEEKYGGDVSAVGFAEDRARLADGEPVAYVIGSQPFLGLDIHLDSRPLIPRPETEWWTEQLLNELARGEPAEEKSAVRLGLAARSAADFSSAGEQHFLDLCAGSGAIGCAALARLPHAHVSFGEIAPAHEATIRKNIEKNSLDAARADVRTGDLFKPFGDERFDVIAINPPYVPSRRTLPESVTAHEPYQALFSGDDGLDLIRRIAHELPDHLAEGGVAWVECDHEHAEDAVHLFERESGNAQILNDQYGEPRVIVVSFS